MCQFYNKEKYLKPFKCNIKYVYYSIFEYSNYMVRYNLLYIGCKIIIYKMVKTKRYVYFKD